MSRHVYEFDWSDEALDRLRTMVAKGYSAGQIARAWGVTRNTIGARIKKLGLERGAPDDVVKMAATIPQPARKSRAKPPEELKKRGAPKDKPVPPAKPPGPRALPADEALTETALHTVDLQAGRCKWPLNDGEPEWLHCGADADDGPYCENHRRKSIGAGTYAERTAA